MSSWLPWRRARRPEPVPMVLYTRPGCCLCDLMKAELERARTRREWRLVEVNIEGDPELLERHGESIPVLEIAGRAAFKGRMSAAEFERKFERRAAEWDLSRASEARR